MGYEYAAKYNAAEMHEKPDNIVTKFLNKIKSIKDRIIEKFHARGKKLEQMTDEAIVHVAKETIAEADLDGERTEEEKENIKEVVETAVVQGAIEEASQQETGADNPIISLNNDEATEPDLIEAIKDLHEQDATLPSGENVAELAVQVIERAEAEEADEKYPRVTLSEAITSLVEVEQSSEIQKRPRTEIICDRNHIEGQRIDVIDKRDVGQIGLSFKLRGVKLNFDNMMTPGGTPVLEDALSYTGINGKKKEVIAPAYSFERNGIRVVIVDPRTRVMAAKGQVKIEAPADMDPKEIEENVAKILEEELGIPNALEEVPEQSEEDYKEAIYGWNHKMGDELTPDQAEKAKRIKRKEVFPGYSTYVDEGKHKEYLETYGEDLRPIHHLRTGDGASIARVLAGGIMCSSERYSRGVIREGMSTSRDFETGGADNVFTRIYDKQSRDSIGGTVIVFKPELLDRMDWYTYNSDEFGSTEDNVFRGRKTPDKLLEAVANKTSSAYNEQMFRTGIGPEYIECIEVDESKRDSILDELRKMGITEFNGKPIEELIVARKNKLIAKEPIWQSSSSKVPIGNPIPPPIPGKQGYKILPGIPVEPIGNPIPPPIPGKPIGNPIPPPIQGEPGFKILPGIPVEPAESAKDEPSSDTPKEGITESASALTGLPISFDKDVYGQQYYEVKRIKESVDEAQKKLDILDGKIIATAQEIIDLCSGEDNEELMMALLAATAKYGDKQQLVEGMKTAIIDRLSPPEIESIAELGLPNNDIGEIISSISDALGVDFEGYIRQAYAESRKEV